MRSYSRAAASPASSGTACPAPATQSAAASAYGSPALASGAIPARDHEVLGAGRLGRKAGGLSGGLGEGRETRRGCGLDQLGDRIDDLRLRVPLARRLVLVAGPAAEGSVRTDGEVVGLLVDEHQPADLGDRRGMGLEEAVELSSGVDQEGRALDRGLAGDLARSELGRRSSRSPGCIQVAPMRSRRTSSDGVRTSTAGTVADGPDALSSSSLSMVP